MVGVGVTLGTGVGVSVAVGVKVAVGVAMISATACCDRLPKKRAMTKISKKKHRPMVPTTLRLMNHRKVEAKFEQLHVFF